MAMEGNGERYKSPPSRLQKALRFLGSVLDPRAWAHLLRMVNYYNHTHVAQRRKMRLGPGAAISPDVVFAHGERISAGRGMRLGSRCMLWAGPGRGRIVIGDDLLCGPEVMITASSYRYNAASPVTDAPLDEADVIIGNDVWLATRVVVLPGAQIGDGAIIGAGAVVRGTIPPGAIAVGSPARVVGQRSAPPPP